jgi:hypothetical protein
MNEDNVISIFKPTKKEIERLEKMYKHLFTPPPPVSDKQGGWDEAHKYSGKLREAMEKYGSFKGSKK